MADVGLAIKYILDNNANVAALIGTKSHAWRASQSTAAPYVVWSIGGVNPSPTKTGASTVDEVSVQVSCVATTYSAASNIGAKVRTALDRYTPATVAGVNIDGIDYNMETDAFDDDLNFYIRHLEFTIRRKN